MVTSVMMLLLLMMVSKLSGPRSHSDPDKLDEGPMGNLCIPPQEEEEQEEEAHWHNGR